jgi:CheY-like chemotaxis protein
MVAADLFGGEGFEVLEARSGDEAWDLIADREELHAVFSDVEMPGDLNGYALVRRVRGRFPAAALIVVSGRSFPRAGDLVEGAVFISKPYDNDVVLSRIYELVERGEASSSM